MAHDTQRRRHPVALVRWTLRAGRVAAVAIAVACAAPPSDAEWEWYLGGDAGGVEATATLYLLNAGERAARAELRHYSTSAEPTVREVEIASGALIAVDLREAAGPTSVAAPVWIRLRSNAPVLPQVVRVARARRDGAVETLEAGPPTAGPLDDTHRAWIYPDGFQGGPPPWQERETLTLLNAGPRDGTARLAVQFRDGRPRLESAIEVPAGRVAEVDLWSRFDTVAGFPAAVQSDYALTVTSDVPMLSGQNRRARRLGDDEVRGSRPSQPIRSVDAQRAREWYYAGGWIVPGDAARRLEDTWQLLFTYGAGAEPVPYSVEPVAGSNAIAPTNQLAPVGRSELLVLHHEPWRTLLGTNRPWGIVLRGDGPVAPAVTVAEYEAEAEGLPGAMDASPLTPGPLAEAWWLGVSRHGSDARDRWATAWQLLNPGTDPIRVALHVFADGIAPAVHHVDVAGRAVVRVSGDELAPRRDGRPFAVVATGSGPFLAHTWLRVSRADDDVTRALVSEPGVAVAISVVADELPHASDAPR